MSAKGFQERLPFPEPPAVVPGPGKNEPTIWVRRFVLRRVPTDPPIQDIPLTRGLNIIWSPPGTDPESFAIGHAAGKSLFCRLLRYCFGEETFADQEDLDAIQKQFPLGVVGIETRVQGKTWSIQRPLNSSRPSLAAEVDLLELLTEHHIGGFSAFTKALQDATAANKLQEFAPEAGNAWLFLLAWLTRDQECRLDGIVHWRYPSSSSKPIVQLAKAEARHNLLRIILRLYSPETEKLKQQAATSDKKAASCETKRLETEEQLETLRKELADRLKISSAEVWPPPKGVLQDEAQAHDAHRNHLKSLARQQVPPQPKVAKGSKFDIDVHELAKYNATLGALAKEIKALETDIATTREKVKLSDETHSVLSAKAREAKYPRCPYDGTPLDVERSRFVCPMATLPDPYSAEQAAKDAENAKNQAKDDLRRLEDLMKGKAAEQARIQTLSRGLETRISSQETRLSEANQAMSNAFAVQQKISQLFEIHRRLKAEIEEEKAAKEKARKAQNLVKASPSEHPPTRLQHWFDFLVRRIFAPDAQGWITLGGKGFSPKIEWRRRQRSVALGSLQVVLFDLAAMLCAVEGLSEAPAFMLHDSPREGDLDQWAYHRIFKALLEFGPNIDTAPFQYIVTTTTNPPEEVQERVRLRLSSDKAENRLFKVDL